MTRIGRNKISRQQGFTLVELMIAVLITGLITTAGFQYFVNCSQQTEAQYDIAEAQHMCRMCMYDIAKTIRMAGYRLDSHPPYDISTNSMTVYYSENGTAIDTVRFYLQLKYDPYVEEGGEPRQVYELMKQVNSDPAGLFADNITSLAFVPIDSANIAVAITAESERADESYYFNDGRRTFSLGERVYIRNL